MYAGEAYMFDDLTAEKRAVLMAGAAALAHALGYEANVGDSVATGRAAACRLDAPSSELAFAQELG